MLAHGDDMLLCFFTVVTLPCFTALLLAIIRWMFIVNTSDVSYEQPFYRAEPARRRLVAFDVAICPELLALAWWQSSSHGGVMPQPNASVKKNSD
jgi:hypothetical protein